MIFSRAGEVEEQAIVLAVLRQQSDPGRDRIGRRTQVQSATAQADLATGQRIYSEQRAGYFAPSRAQHSAEPEHFAAMER